MNAYCRIRVEEAERQNDGSILWTIKVQPGGDRPTIQRARFAQSANDPHSFGNPGDEAVYGAQVDLAADSRVTDLYVAGQSYKLYPV